MAEVSLVRLNVGSMLPSFTLQTAGGREFSTWSVKSRKNLVIFVLGEVCDEDCSSLLTDAAGKYKRYKAENAEVLTIFRMNREYADEVRHDLKLPFLVLADVDGAVSSQLVYRPPAVFVTDRYGEVRSEYLGEDAMKVKQEELLARVELNELECPE